MNSSNYETRNGQQVILTGQTKTTDRFTYKQAQMLPIHPQRLEWINERNLRKSK